MNVDNINNKAVENNDLKNLFDIKNIYEKIGNRDLIKKTQYKTLLKAVGCSAALVVALPIFLPIPLLAYSVLLGMNFSFYKKYKKESDSILLNALSRTDGLNSAFKGISTISAKTKTDYYLKMKILSVSKDYAKSASVPKLLKQQFIAEADSRLFNLNKGNPFFKIDLKKYNKELELANIFDLNTVDLLELKKSMNISIKRLRIGNIINKIFTKDDLKILNSIDSPDDNVDVDVEELENVETNTNKATLPREVKNQSIHTHENITENVVEQSNQQNLSTNETSSLNSGILGEKIKLNRTLKETEDKLNQILTLSDFLTLNEKTNLKDIQDDLSSVKEITKQNIYGDKDIVNKMYELFNDQNKIINRISDRLANNQSNEKSNNQTMKAGM